MKKFLFALIILTQIVNPCFAWNFFAHNNEEKAVEKLLKQQVRYANRENFDKFINTYAVNYLNADGLTLEDYSNLVKDIWKTFDKIKYDIDIKNISISDGKATVDVIESSYADLQMSKAYDGELKSISNSIYYLEKINGKWKVVSDSVLEESTSMLYGQAKDLDIKLTVPNNIEPNKEYTATLEFIPPKETIAIASIASDIVEYPQKPTQEVFRALPEDNILERLFTSNNQNANEYIIASIGLTKTDVCDLSIKLNLTGFGYAIKRVNVIPSKTGDNNDKKE